MRLDQLLLTFHILAAAIWIGAALAEQVMAARIGPSTEDIVVRHFAKDAEVVGKRLFGPSAIVLVVTGVALVVHERLPWSQLWIGLGIGAFVAAGAVGGAFLVPEGRRLAALADDPAHDPVELRERTRRRFLVARLDLAILTLAVADMVFRPGR